MGICEQLLRRLDRAAKTLRAQSLIPAASFAVPDVDAEYRRLTSKSVRFAQPPVDHKPVFAAVFDDTCGNLIQISEEKRKP
jgi:predicted enzyme related to lactoylglutathione lyase